MENYYMNILNGTPMKEVIDMIIEDYGFDEYGSRSEAVKEAKFILKCSKEEYYGK